ncbi:MAG: ornithine cyclodeaminase family protein [Deltaproteobacteria bacterium]|nr:ornithine cyclodeaminase family protein [Deltaproteobacteria bacterium]
MLIQLPIILTDSDIDAELKKVDIKNILNTAFISLYNNEATQPSQTLTLFPGGRGDFITYLGVLATLGVFGAKLSPYITDGPKPLVTAWTILMSMKTGQPILLCDSARLTSERTAGTTALAVDRLAKKDSQILAVLGSGRLALAHLKHVATLRAWQEIRVFSPKLNDSPQRLKDFQAVAPKGVKVLVSSEARQAVGNADVVMLATSSGTPVIDVKDVKNGALITSISTNAPKAHEIDPKSLADLEVYCDYAPTTPMTAGEMVIAREAGLWSEESLKGDLPALCAGKVSVIHSERPIFFRSVGLGLEDVAIAYALYQAASGKSHVD